MTAAAQVYSNSSADLLSAHNVFAMGLYNAFAQAKPGQNFVFSPISIFATLSMILPGAQKQTLQQLLSAMRLTPGGSGQPLPTAAALSQLESALGSLLVSAAPSGDGAGRQDGLLSANQAFIQSGLDLRPEFLAALRDRIRSEIVNADFMKNPDAERKRINDWVAKVTKGKISDLMSPSSITPSTRLVLANALYFNAKWTLPFDPKSTADAPFELSSSKKVTVPMMSNQASFPIVFVRGAFFGVRFGFKGTGAQKMSLLAVLPVEKHGLDKLLAGMSEKQWLQLVNEPGRERKMIVSLPKVKLVGEAELSDPEYLPKLGLTNLFGSSADLSGIASNSGGLYVSRFAHKAALQWDELGAEGAAATAAEESARSMPSEIRFDQPFLVVVTREVTGSDGKTSQVPIFLSRVSDPSS